MPITEIDTRLQHRNASGDTTVIYPITKADNIEGTFPIASGGTGATTAAAALTNLGITATATELNYADSVTSDIQTQIDGKAASSHNHSASNITSGTLSLDRLPTVPITKGGTGATTAATALTNLGITATATELNYVEGVTSDIQNQLNGKAASSHNHSVLDITSGTLSSDRLPTVPVTKGGTGASNAAIALANLGAAKAFTYGTADISAGSTSSEADGAMHFVYTTKNGVWDHVKSIFITVDGVWRLVWVKSYSITTNLTNMTMSSTGQLPSSINTDASVSGWFVADDGYQLPKEIVVENAEYIWNSDTGYLSIYNPTGNVSVTIAGFGSYYITTNLTGLSASSSNPTTISTDNTSSNRVVLHFTEDDGYALPGVGSTTVKNADYDWNLYALYLYNPTGNVEVTLRGVDVSSGESGQYTTTIKIDDEIVYTKSAANASPDVEINVYSSTSGDDECLQYVRVDEGLRYDEEHDVYVPDFTYIFSYTDGDKNLLGLSETSGSTLATYEPGSHTFSGAKGAHRTINLYTVVEDAPIYATRIHINDDEFATFSYKNFAPNVQFTVIDDGLELYCPLTNERYAATYNGDYSFAGVVIEGVDYSIGTSDWLGYCVGSDYTVDFEWSEWVVSGDVQPLKFYTLDGSEFTVSTLYGQIPNVEYSYDNSSWTTNSGGLTQNSALTSKNGVIYLRGTNNAFGAYGINSRGIGMTFSKPVMCAGDLTSMLTYDGLVDEIDARRFFGFFMDSVNLLCPPNLPSTTLDGRCYEALCYNCSSMKVYTSPVDGYSREWRVPTSGTATVGAGSAYAPLVHAFANTAGTAVDTLDVNTTYYIKDDPFFNITTNLTGVTASGSNKSMISTDGVVELYFTANSGYTLPSTVEVEGATYTWDPLVGSLVLRNPTGNVTVTIVGVGHVTINISSYYCTPSESSVSVKVGEKATVTFVSSTSYEFANELNYLVYPTSPYLSADWTRVSSSRVEVTFAPTSDNIGTTYTAQLTASAES